MLYRFQINIKNLNLSLPNVVAELAELTFPEAEVLALLARNPLETDIIKLLIVQ